MKIDVKRDKDTILLDLEIDLPGSPEEVWAAIATGPGIGCWFVPAEVEERVGGAIVMHLLPGIDAPATVTAWEPPRRFAYEERDWAGPGRDAEPLATEFVIEAQRGGTCRLRMVTSCFSSGADWEDEFFEGMRKGWGPFFTNLVLYLTGFSGQRSVVLDAHADHPGPLDTAFEQLLSALDPSGAVRSEGAELPRAEGRPPLAGVVHRASESDVILRITEPAPGYGMFTAYPWEEKVRASFQAHFFGDDAERVAREQKPLWERWLTERVRPAE